MYLMPIIFTFFFLKMPSGLVIYWLTNSLLTIGVQWYLMRRAAAIEVVK
jgi:YidC/Oxa1 family membrane protein insertase